MFSSYSSAPSFVDMVNRVLMAAHLAPVPSLTGVSPESDAGIAAYRLYSVMRGVAARGWWFNTFRGKTYRESSGLITVPRGLHATASPVPYGQPAPPCVRLEVPEGSGTPILFNETDNTNLWDTDYEIDLDVVTLPVNTSLPIEFTDYCVLKASRQFAATFAIAVDDTDEIRAWDALDKKDTELGPRHNRFANPQLATQVLR